MQNGTRHAWHKRGRAVRSRRRPVRHGRRRSRCGMRRGLLRGAPSWSGRKYRESHRSRQDLTGPLDLARRAGQRSIDAIQSWRSTGSRHAIPISAPSGSDGRADAQPKCRGRAGGATARLHSQRREDARSRGARSSALPQGVGAAPEQPRRPGHRRRRLPDEGAARRHRRADPARAGSRQHHRPGAARQPRGVPGARRRARRDSRRGGLARSGLVQGPRRRLVATGRHEVAGRADASLLHRPSQPHHPGRVQLGDGRRDLLRHGPRAAGAGAGGRLYAEAGRRAQRAVRAAGRRAHRRRQARERVRRPAADVDLRADDGRRPQAVPGVRVATRSPVRELHPARLPGDPAAGGRLGRPAHRRGHLPERRGTRRRAPLRPRRPHAPVEGDGASRSPSGFQPVARRRRAARPEGDRPRLGRARPPLGRRDAGVSQRAQAAERRCSGRTAAR